jgi:hypothetical protein
MSKRKCRLGQACSIALLAAVVAFPAGCNSNPNEDEFNRTASPGKLPEPESVASRRERTKNVPKVAPDAKDKGKKGGE